MKSSTLIGTLLVAAVCAIDLAVIGEIQVRKNEWPAAAGVMGIGLAFAQVVLISLWAVWGRFNVIVRSVTALVAVFLTAFVGSYSTDGHGRETNEWFGVLLLYAALTIVPFTVARMAGFQLNTDNRLKLKVESSSLATNQYTVWGLMSLMTAVAIACAVMRFVAFPIGEAVAAAVFFSLLAAVACSTSFSFLHSRVLWIPIVVALIAYPVAGIILGFVDFAPNHQKVELIFAIVTQGIVTAAAMLMLRSGGFR